MHTRAPSAQKAASKRNHCDRQQLNAKAANRVSTESLLNGEYDPKGRQFLLPSGPRDLRNVRILHTGVDTLRQLYQGTVRTHEIGLLHGQSRWGDESVVTWAGYEWVIGSGGRSGYRYRLQNNELGLIVLLGSRYKRLQEPGSHLKIECSPHFLKDNPPERVQAELDRIAATLLHDPTHHAVAVHVAIDVQGWKPPRDFTERIRTRARRKTDHTGFDSLEFVGGETAQRYEGGQSYLFGSSSSVQFATYRKDLEAHKRDKLDWWESVWREAAEELDEPSYREGKPVWRLEWRFHHNVVQQIQSEDGKGFRAYTDIAPVLTNLFRYGLNLFRLHASPTYADPMWQLLFEDVTIHAEATRFVVRRVQKTPGRGNEKNLVLALGNMLSLYAREGYSTRQVIHHLKSAGFWKDLVAYWQARGKDPQKVITHGLQKRILAT
ncbi:hypothetical protein [Arhodomonas sp. AD133]|uniref:hypothetical protein n=1 Tax=Arhodomonas sp. AD133 TaxID=3415009 RepID=UPI003EBE8FC3